MVWGHIPGLVEECTSWGCLKRMSCTCVKSNFSNVSSLMYFCWLSVRMIWTLLRMWCWIHPLIGVYLFRSNSICINRDGLVLYVYILLNQTLHQNIMSCFVPLLQLFCLKSVLVDMGLSVFWFVFLVYFSQPFIFDLCKYL